MDLGCGLGASLLYLASRIDMSGEGITLSPQQAARSADLAALAGAESRVRCREGNFLSVPEDLAGKADLTFSIEAFLHSPDADGYFREAARTLRPGGSLVICDDFRTPAAASRRGARLLDQRGGRVRTRRNNPAAPPHTSRTARRLPLRRLPLRRRHQSRP